MFDPNTFVNTQYTDSVSTTYTPVPEGVYVAVAVGEPKARQTEKDGNTYTMLDLYWELDGQRHPNVAEVTGREKNTVRQTMFLDLNSQGNLDLGAGKNVQLGRTLEAVGIDFQNGAPWSINHIIGRAANINVKHRPGALTREPQANVVAVTKLS